MLLCIVVAGLKFSIPTAVAGFLFSLGRILCTIGLLKVNKKIKMAGDFMWEVALFALLILSILTFVWIYI